MAKGGSKKLAIDRGHTAIVYDIAITPDDKSALSAGGDGMIKLWDIKKGKEIKTFSDSSNQNFGQELYTSIAITPDGKQFISLTAGGDIKLWNMTFGKVKKRFKAKYESFSASDVVITTDGKSALIGGENDDGIGVLTLWDIRSGKMLKSTKGFTTSGGQSLALSPDGELALFVSENKNKHRALKLWNIKNWNEVKLLTPAPFDNQKQKLSPDAIGVIGFSPDNKYASSIDIYYYNNSYSDKTHFISTERIWEIATGKEVKSFESKPNFPVTAAIIMPDGKSTLTSTLSHELSVLRQRNWSTGDTVKVLKGQTSEIISIALSKDGKQLISGGDELTVWNINEGRVQTHFKPINEDVGYSSVAVTTGTHLALSTLLSDTDDGRVIVSDLNTRKVIRELEGHSQMTLTYPDKKQKLTKDTASITITPDDKYVITTGYRDIKKWDLNTGKEVSNFTLKGAEGTFIDGKPVISPDGKFLLFEYTQTGDKTMTSGTLMENESGKEYKWSHGIKVWNIKSSKIVNTMKGSFDGFALLPDNKSMLYIDESTPTKNSGKCLSPLQLLNFKTGEKQKGKICTFDNCINNITASSNGKYVLAVGVTGTLQLCDVENKKTYPSFQGHEVEDISSIIDSKGKLAISSSYDGSVKFWDIKKGKELVAINRFSDNSWIAITPEGYFTGSQNALRHLNITKTTKEGMEPFDMSQLYDHFFRPDLVKLKIAGKDISQYTGGLTYKDALKNPPPKLVLNSVDNIPVISSSSGNQAVNTNKPQIKLSFNVNESDQGGVGLIRIYQEGKLIQSIGEGKVNKQSANLDSIIEQQEQDNILKEIQKRRFTALSKAVKGGTTEEEVISAERKETTRNKPGVYKVEIELKSGSNEISIEAFNKTNTVSSYRETIVVKADIPAHKPNLYVIVAGVNEFESPNVNNLKYSQNDAQAIKEQAEKKMQTIFDHVEVVYLIGKEVTKAHILKAANSIAQKAKLDDTILFYISTHGRAAKGQLYLAPYNNAHFKDWINFEEVFAAIQSVKALNQIFIIDACESGKANDIVSSVYDSRASVLAKSSGVHVFLATTKGTSAFEHPDPRIKNGVFTYQILQALKNKDTDYNNDNLISVLELSKSLNKSANNSDFQYPVIRNVGNDISLRRIH